MKYKKCSFCGERLDWSKPFLKVFENKMVDRVLKYPVEMYINPKARKVHKLVPMGNICEICWIRRKK